MIAAFVGVKVVAADAGAQRGDNGADFGGVQHLVKTGAFNVQNFTAQRLNSLIAAVASLFGRAARGISLHNEDFGQGGVFFLAVGQLAGQGRNIHCAFAAGQVAGFAGRFAGCCRFHDFAHDNPRVGRVFVQPFFQLVTHHAFNHRAHL